MQSVLILSPSFSPARAIAVPGTGPEGDPDGGFRLALAGGGAVDDDGEIAGDPAEVAGQMAAGPVLLWAGAVAKGGGTDAAVPAEAAARIETAGPLGTGATLPASARGGPVALAWEMASPAPPVSGAEGASGGGRVMRLGVEGQHPVEVGPVTAVIGGAGQAAGSPEACAGAPETGRGVALAEPLPQVTAPAMTVQIPRPRPGQGQVAVPGQRDAGGPGVGAVVPWMGDADGVGAGPIAGLTGGGGDLAPTGPNARATLPAQPDAKRVPAPVSAPRVENAMTGDGMLARAEMLAGDGVVTEPISVPEGAARWPARVAADERPQAGFWERLLSGMADTRAFAKAGDGPAGSRPSTRPEDRVLAPLPAPVGIPPAVLPEGAGLTKPGVVGLVPQTWPAEATAERFASAEPTASEAASPAPDVALRATAPDFGPRSTGSGPGASSALSLAEAAPPAPHVALKTTAPDFGPRSTGSGPGASLALPLAEAAPEPDPSPEASGDPSLFAPGVPPLSPPGPQASSAPGASPVPIPHLAAQLVAALTRQTGDETELALSPEELGHVRVKLKPDAAHPDRLVVMITFERPETLDLFRRHAGELTDALRSAGYSGADIGFGQQGSGQKDRGTHAGTAGQSVDGIPRPDPAGAAHPLPRHPGAASLDLRL